MSSSRLRTVVADTSGPVNLAVTRADAPLDTDTPDPFQDLLISCVVFVPPKIVAELLGITQFLDIYASPQSALAYVTIT
nr:hypothetical protein [Halovivax cerinus]